MRMKNPALQTIYDNVVSPALKKQRKTMRGHVTAVYYDEGKIDVVYYERDSNAQRVAKRVAMPQEADGVYRSALKTGDEVEVSFRNGSKTAPYVSFVYGRNDRFERLLCEEGNDLPESLDLF